MSGKVLETPVMKAKILASLLLVLGVFTGYAIGAYRTVAVHAAAPSSIPSSYGACKGATPNGQLIFEATDGSGTIRLVNGNGSLDQQFVRR
jgi:hypothetical protein